MIEKGNGGRSGRRSLHHVPQLIHRTQPAEIFSRFSEDFEQTLRPSVLWPVFEHRPRERDGPLLVATVIDETRQFHHQVDVRRRPLQPALEHRNRRLEILVGGQQAGETHSHLGLVRVLVDQIAKQNSQALPVSTTFRKTLPEV